MFSCFGLDLFIDHIHIGLYLFHQQLKYLKTKTTVGTFSSRFAFCSFDYIKDTAANKVTESFKFYRYFTIYNEDLGNVIKN